ncbi:MAG: hypothetical protein ACLFSJ_03160 [Halorhodospira sp.]
MASLQNTIAQILTAYRDAGGDVEDFILIGGNAGYQWYFALADEQDLNIEDGHPLDTRDIDFHLRSGSQQETSTRIEALAEAIGAQVQRPSLGDATPELARLEIPDFFGPDEPLMIDILPSPHGLDAGEIERHAERLYYLAEDGADGTQTFEYPVLHPVHVVIGLCENYIKLPSKRNELTLERIRALLPIVQRYLTRQGQSAGPPEPGEEPQYGQERKETRWGIQTLMKYSANPRYASLFVEHGIDLTTAVPDSDEVPLNPEFWELEMPKLRRAVERRRQAAKNRIGQNRPSRLR